MVLSSLVWRAGGLLTSLVTSRLDQMAGLPLAEAEVLMATRVRGDLTTTPRDLRAQLHLTSAGITKRIDQVEAKGLLGRRAPPLRSPQRHAAPHC